MASTFKKVLVGLGALIGVSALGGGGYVLAQVHTFDTSMEKVYDIPVPAVPVSTEPAVIARGRHLAESIGGCAMRDCHGPDLSGGTQIDIGPVGAAAGPNITPAGMLAVYSDGEIGRLIKTGIKKDGRSVRMMSVQSFYWLPDSDVAAIVSYLRTVPPADKPNGTTRVGILGKLLDRQGIFPWDIARFVSTLPRETPPSPAPTREYGKFVAKLCSGCHGDGSSGGRLPGAPPSMAVPLNLTPHETGLKDWSYEDFARMLDTGIRKNGKKLDPFMQIEGIRKLNEDERQALWAYLRSLPPKPFGGR